MSTSLAVDYQETFKIWHVHDMVDERLGLDYSYSKLAGMVSVNNPSGSHFLYIRIQTPDPEEAKLLADTYADVVQDFIAEKMELRRPQVLEMAQLPTRPISPDIRGVIIKAFMVGLFTAAAVVVLIYLLDDKIRTSEDVEKSTGLATLGEMSRQDMREEASITTSAPKSGYANSVVINQGLTLSYEGSEAINTICSGIIFAGKSLKKIAVTSYAPDNGKTFISAHIAISMAKRGKRVLLIDGDLRKSVLVSRFRIKRLTYHGAANGTMISELAEGKYALLNKVTQVSAIADGLKLCAENPQYARSIYPPVSAFLISSLMQTARWCSSKRCARPSPAAWTPISLSAVISAASV